MSSLLEGLTVGLAGNDRPLLVAARCLSDLGARVLAAPGGERATADRLWLGDHGPWPDGVRVDIELRGDGAVAAASRATHVVGYRAVSTLARNAGQHVDERGLSAVGGMAIAVGRPDEPPLPMPDGSIDTMVGFHLAGAALGAVLEGVTETEVAGADVVAWAVTTNMHLYKPYGLDWHRAGRRASGSGSCYPYALFEAADGLFCMIGRTDRDWLALRAAMGDPEWAHGRRFKDPRLLGRQYPEEADRYVGPWVARQTRDELMSVLVEHSFPGAPVLRPDEVLALPSLSDRWVTAEHGGADITVPGRAFDVVPAPADDGDAKPLSDVLVLDLSWVWSGPAVSVGLADLGATVVKIESATRPDNARLRGRPHAGVTSDDAPLLEVAPYFHALNRGKQSIALDLTTAEGRAVLWELAKKADVIVENLTAGVMDRFGIPPERVHEVNPGCIFLSMRGYRDHPSTKGLRAYAPALSSSAGLEAMVAYPGEAPIGAMTIAFSDALATSQGILLVLAARHARRTQAAGAAVTLSQFEAAVMANGHNLVADQLGMSPGGLKPFAESSEEVVCGEQLPVSSWISPDLFANVHPHYLAALGMSRLPWRQDGQLPAVGTAAPRLGEHTTRILTERLGLDQERIADLSASGALT